MESSTLESNQVSDKAKMSGEAVSANSVIGRGAERGCEHSDE